MLPKIELPEKAMIRYLGPDHTFPYVSYYQALDPDKYLPRDFFRDQIVLVGRDTKASPDAGAAQADTFSTPFTASTRWLTPGVELHANILENALSGLALSQSHPAARYGLLLVAVLLSALGMHRWRPVLSALLGIILIGAIMALDWWLFLYRNIWLPAASPLAGIMLMYVGQGGMAFYVERHRKRQIRQAFEHYVSPQVVAEMIAHPERLKLGGQKREVTLLFTDLQGFTVISERMSPEDVSQLLNHHLTEMAQIIMRHNGTVDKFIGDAVMAFWGAPLDDPQQAIHACLAAVEMQAAMAVMREHLASEGLPPLHMRIGIHSGRAIVGNMGSNDRFDYSAIGDTVNLASRLEGINKLYGTEILLSEYTAALLGKDFPLRQV
ncbi:MAG: Adenylate/guanylate cyclase with Chase sensor, partial [uncultured bacterium]